MKNLLILILLLASVCRAEPFMEKTDLFTIGDMGYKRFHIPGIVVTAKGTVLAWCEARKNGSDWDEIDILLRRSTDDGNTWSEPKNITEVPGPKTKNPFALQLKHADPNTVTYNNPVLIADRDGTVHMLFCLEYMRCFYQRSDDDGLTWSTPVEITDTFQAFKKDYDWKVLATGPNHSIQLENGRLVVPVWLSTGTGGNAHRPSVTSTIYSDDGGKTWLAGDIAVPCTDEFINPNETVAVQLKDGRVMLNVRSESKAHRRIVVTSPDGATNWSEPRFQEDLVEPICMGGLVRYEHGDKSLLLFSNPNNLEGGRGGKPVPGKSRARKNVTVYISKDEGESWPVKRSIESGWSAYSDIAVTKKGTILCFYGRGPKAGFAGDMLTVARFNLEWISSPDVAIYGGTSGGVIAAVQAARMGKSVFLIEPGKHLGGMTSGGLSAVDIGEPRSVGGLAREYFTRLVARYGKELNWGEAFDHGGKGGPKTGGAYSIEPHVAEDVFDQMLREAGVTVIRDARIAAVEKDDSKITGIVFENGPLVRAKMYIDATYEGDLMAAAGVNFTVTREGNQKYGETYNGIYYAEQYKPRNDHLQPGNNGRVKGGQGVWDRDFPLDPYIEKGNPGSGILPLINAGEPGTPGEPAPGVQAYCYRLCLTTDPENSSPIAPPPNYDPARYELIARFIEACEANGDDMDLRWFSKYDPLPNQKWDFNTATFGGNLPGLSWKWPVATWWERQTLAKELENYHRGVFHFLRTDPRVPVKVKTELARFGLPKDEFLDTGGWPHQVYVREGRRMISDLVMTEHHTFGREYVDHSVGLGSYGTDAHEIRRIVKDGVVTREGKIARGRDGFGPYQIGYGAIVPKKSECENLFVTFALSASHSAFASIRMEPPFMITSQSAATAACLAIDSGVPIQDIDHDVLKKTLIDDGQILEWQHAPKRPKLNGIVLDDSAATFTGEWTTSSATGSVIGRNYRHDAGKERGSKSATFTPRIPKTGNYDVRLLYTSHENRATNAVVVISSQGKETKVLQNQELPPMKDGEPRSLGVFTFQQGTVNEVTLLNRDANGIVSVDGLQLVPVDSQ
ncbi:MAG: FAD-dependent oxidoreductase [Verrucomicrobiales bacterium]|nr:FAD-dependent oxidoreductase [Verrucomicrobiales bacterium]